MAENKATMLIEETTVPSPFEQRGGAARQRRGAYGAIAAALIAVLIVGVALHDRQTSHPVAPANPLTVPSSAETRFFNTTNFPNAVIAETRPVVTSAQQKHLDVNVAWLPTTAAEMAPSIMTSSQRRFLEVNTVMLPTVVNADSALTTGALGALSTIEADVNRVCHFTFSDAYMCAVFRTDGTWLRDETMGHGGWIVTAQAAPVSEQEVNDRGDNVATSGDQGCNDEMLCPWLYEQH